jgi:hypothetical protein
VYVCMCVRMYVCMYVGFTQLLTEVSARNIKIIMFLGSKVRRVRKADNFTAMYEPII